MATVFRTRRKENTGAGGKVLRGRQVAAAYSPYTRLKSPPDPESHSNWIVGLFSPATRMIAIGAGKLISSVFGSGRSPSSSWSSSDSNCDKDDNEFSCQGVQELNQNGMSSRANKFIGREHQSSVQKNKGKLAIEELLKEETFSREECDRLMRIIQSRVVDCPTMKDRGDIRQEQIPDGALGNCGSFLEAVESQWQTRNSLAVAPYMAGRVDSISQADTPDLQNTAIIEARKWLEERKLESGSKSEMDYGTCSLDNVMVAHANDVEVRSPVDMAKSYMRARPSWASPSSGHFGSKTPSPSGVHFKKETACSFNDDSFSSSKRRNSLATGSWNIMEEIRRVRAKATDNLLRSVSKPNNLSTIALESKGGNMSSSNGKTIGEATEAVHDSKSPPAIKSIGASMMLEKGMNSNGSRPETLTDRVLPSAALVPEVMHEGRGNGAMSARPTTLNSECNQDLEGIEVAEREIGVESVLGSRIPDSITMPQDDLQEFYGERSSSELRIVSSEDIKPILSEANDFSSLDGMNKSNQQLYLFGGEDILVKTFSESHQLPGVKGKHSIDGLRAQGGNHSASKNINESTDKVTDNGIPSYSSLSAGQDVEANLRHFIGGDSNPTSSSLDKLVTGIPIQENCELLSEASVEVPNMNEIDSIANESQNSSSRKNEVSKSQTRWIVSSSSVDKSSDMIERQQEKKTRRYRRRGRGRGQ